MECTVRDLHDMDRVAELVLADLVSYADHATVVTLSGDLGSGKTAFVQAVARKLGITETVTSPTFTIENRYVLPSDSVPQFTELIHIDAYRIHEERELEVLGWRDLLARGKTLILIEWPERIPRLVGTVFARMRFDHINESSRSISYERTA